MGKARERKQPENSILAWRSEIFGLVKRGIGIGTKALTHLIT